MSDELEERLRGALTTVPPTDRARELRARTAALGAVPHTPRWPRRALRYAVPAVGFAGLAGLLILAAPRGQESPGADEGTDISVSVLNRPQGPEDHLPEWVANDPVVIVNAIDPTSVRRVATSGGRLFFVARGRAARTDQGLRPTGSRTICFIDPVARTPGPDYRPGRAGRVSCRLPGVFTQANLVEGNTHRLGQTSRFASVLTAVVPDGHDRLVIGSRSWPVRANFAYVRRIENRPEWVPRSGPPGPAPAPRPRPESEPMLVGAAGREPLNGLPVKEPRGEPGDSAFRGYGLDSAGPGDRPFEPTAVTFVAFVRPGVTRVSAGGRSARVRNGMATLKDIPASPFEPFDVVASGPRGTSTLHVVAGFLGRGGDKLSPFRNR